MAKKSAVEKNNRRRKMVDRFAAKRKALKAIVMDRARDPEERFDATLEAGRAAAQRARRCGSATAAR